MYGKRLLVMTALLVLSGLGSGPGHAADCNAMKSSFERAVEKRQVDDAINYRNDIYDDARCAKLHLADARRRLADLEVQLAADPALAGGDERRTMLLTDAVDMNESWKAAEVLGDLSLGRRKFAQALQAYERSIGLAGRDPSIGDAEKERLLARAGAAKRLASDDQEGRQTASLATSTRGPEGIGGIYSSLFTRGARPHSVPLPIQFETNSADLTPTGKAAADELFEALQQQNASAVVLVGHTDDRGSDAYNMDLSARRVHTVADYLQGRGLKARFTLLAKGKSQPYDVSALPFKPSQDETWALDRRVEWVRQ